MRRKQKKNKGVPLPETPDLRESSVQIYAVVSPLRRHLAIEPIQTDAVEEFRYASNTGAVSLGPVPIPGTPLSWVKALWTLTA